MNATSIAKDDLSDAYVRLAIVSVKLQQPKEAVRYFQLHQQIFGTDHPGSVKLEDYFIDHNVDLGF